MHFHLQKGGPYQFYELCANHLVKNIFQQILISFTKTGKNIIFLLLVFTILFTNYYLIKAVHVNLMENA